jgi:hypothetical protein
MKKKKPFTLCLDCAKLYHLGLDYKDVPRMALCVWCHKFKACRLSDLRVMRRIVKYV